jgi:hypothetical protein
LLPFQKEKKALEILRVNIMAILIDDLPIKEEKPKSSSITNKSNQPKLLF